MARKTVTRVKKTAPATESVTVAPMVEAPVDVAGMPATAVVAPVATVTDVPVVAPAETDVPAVEKVPRVRKERVSFDVLMKDSIATLQAVQATLRGAVSNMKEAVKARDRDVREATKTARGRKQRTDTDGTRQKAGFNMATLLKDQLADYLREVCGYAEATRGAYMSRVRVTHLLHDHFEKAEMHDVDDKRKILFQKDARFTALLSEVPTDSGALTYFNLQHYLKHQFYKKSELEELS